MMTNGEVQAAVNAIQNAQQYMLDIDISKPSERKIIEVQSSALAGFLGKSDLAVVKSTYSELRERKELFGKSNNKSSIVVGLYTWFSYNHIYTSAFTTSVILKPNSITNSINLYTNSSSDHINYGYSLGIDSLDTFEIHTPGTPDCEEYLFLKSLEYEDLVMNALLFQYEWRAQQMGDVTLRLGTDALQTCLSIEKVAKEAYEKYFTTSSNT